MNYIKVRVRDYIKPVSKSYEMLMILETVYGQED